MNSKKIVNTIYYIVISMLVIILVNNFMSKSDSIFKAVGFRTYSILSGSMEPEINTGDLAIVKSIDAEDVKVGEIITFKYEGKVVTHRVVEKNEEGFITKEWIKNNLPLNGEFFFCGPTLFMKSIRNSLKDLGVKEDNINFEFFGKEEF